MLLDFALAAVTALQQRGVAAGDRVLLAVPTSVGFLTAFFACQLMGAVPVPLVPPWSRTRLERQLDRLRLIAQKTRARATIVDDRVITTLRRATEADAFALPDVGMFITTEELFSETTRAAPRTDSAAPALLQFTSGSTARPKGVVLSQANLLSNLEAMRCGLQIDPSDVYCSWLPLFHDMGLIGLMLTPIYCEVPVVLLAPEAFTRQPRVWLEMIHDSAATVTVAPNSAYDLCARRLRDEDVKRLDLSSLRLALCGAEPVLESTERAFSTRFGAQGFRREVFTPVYGLAESTLAVTIPPLARGIRVRDGVRPLGDVSVGRPISDHELRIVDSSGETCSDAEEGFVQVRGPSVMQGYFDDPLETEATLRQGWLHTGDCGYLADGELYVTGRHKEVIIKGGVNVYPYDLEAVATDVEQARVSQCAAFGYADAEMGTDRIVLVCETSEKDGEAQRRAARTVVAAVFQELGIHVDEIRWVRRGTLTRTPSGKLQRALLRKRYLAAELGTS